MSIRNVQFTVATHIMTVLGHRHGTDVTSTVLAESVNADPSFVRRTVSKLAKSGLVVAKRGKNGACVLAREPEDISLLDIYLASEAPAAFAIHAYPENETCVISPNIKGSMQDVLADVQAGFEDNLKQKSLASIVADVVKRDKKLKRAKRASN